MFHLVIQDAHMRLCHLPWVKLPPWQAGSGQLDVVAERLQVVAGAVAERHKVTGGMALRKGPSLAERESQITAIILTCIIDHSFRDNSCDSYVTVEANQIHISLLSIFARSVQMLENLPCPAGMATTLASLQLGPQRSAIARHESMVDTPRVTWCTQRPGPGKSLNTSRAAKSQPFSMTSWRKAAHAARVRFPETPKYSHSKKNSPITCEQLRRAVSANNSQLSKRYSNSHRCSAESQVVNSTCDLFLLLGWCLQLHVDLTFRLRFGVRKSVHQLEAMPHPSRNSNFWRKIFKLTILDLQ